MARQAPKEKRKVVVARLDRDEPFNLREGQQKLGESSGPRSYIDDLTTDVRGEPSKQPLIIVLRPGECIEL